MGILQQPCGCISETENGESLAVCEAHDFLSDLRGAFREEYQRMEIMAKTLDFVEKRLGLR